METAVMSLQKFFKIKASESRYADELDDALLEWSYMKVGGTVWEIVEDHITSQAARFNMTPEKCIHYFFEAEDVEDFMSRFNE